MPARTCSLASACLRMRMRLRLHLPPVFQVNVRLLLPSRISPPEL